MTRIDELKQQIADKTKRVNDLNTLVNTEKRVKTEAERTDFDNSLTEISQFGNEIKDIERIEKLRIDAPVIITGEQKAKNRVYNPVKAINEFNRGLTGLEKEVHDECSRSYTNLGKRAEGLLIPNELIYKRTDTISNSEGLYFEQAQGLDIIQTPSLIETLGLTQYPNMTGVVKLNFAQGLTADKVAEGAGLSDKNLSKTTDSLTPERVGYISPMSEEALSVTSIFASSLLDADLAIKAALVKEIITNILTTTGCTLTGFASNATAIALTAVNAGKLRSAVLAPSFQKPAFVMGSELYSFLQNMSGATAYQTFIQDSKINGYSAIDIMNLLVANASGVTSAIFGDWSRGYVGFWGSAMEVLLNPYTYDSTGIVRVRFSRLADTSFNPYAFKTIQNAKI
jgi:HK97 family phage major capsid protein